MTGKPAERSEKRVGNVPTDAGKPNKEPRSDFYEVFHPKWIAKLQMLGISPDQFAKQAENLNLVNRKTILNWLKGNILNPLSGDHDGAAEIVLKTLLSLRPNNPNDFYGLVNHSWPRKRFWEAIKGRTLEVKGQWLLSPIPNDLEPNWDDYGDLVRRLKTAASPANPARRVGIIEAHRDQTALHINALIEYSEVIDAFSLVFYQQAGVSELQWEEFGIQLKKEAERATKQTPRPVLVILANAEITHVRRLRKLIDFHQGNEYVFLVSTRQPEVLDKVGVPEGFQHDLRSPQAPPIDLPDDWQVSRDDETLEADTGKARGAISGFIRVQFTSTTRTHI